VKATSTVSNNKPNVSLSSSGSAITHTLSHRGFCNPPSWVLFSISHGGFLLVNLPFSMGFVLCKWFRCGGQWVCCDCCGFVVVDYGEGVGLLLVVVGLQKIIIIIIINKKKKKKSHRKLL
jgi:hypothetical protein